MKANKVTVEIEVECLHIDSVRGLILDLIERLRDENVSGKLVKEDVDTVIWNTRTQPIEF